MSVIAQAQAQAQAQDRARTRAQAVQRTCDLLLLEPAWDIEFTAPSGKHSEITTARHRSSRRPRPSTTLKYTCERQRQDPSEVELPVLVGPIPYSRAEAISFLRQAFPSLNLYPANRIGLFVSSNWPPDATPVPYVPEVRPWWAIPSVESQLAPVMVPVADHVWAQFQADPPARIHAAILRDPACARFPYNVHIRMIVEGMLIGLVLLLLILVATAMAACTWLFPLMWCKWLVIRGIRWLLCLPVVARQLELDAAYMCSITSTSGT